jgi:hypothetical protein
VLLTFSLLCVIWIFWDIVKGVILRDVENCACLPLLKKSSKKKTLFANVVFSSRAIFVACLLL